MKNRWTICFGFHGIMYIKLVFIYPEFRYCSLISLIMKYQCVSNLEGKKPTQPLDIVTEIGLKTHFRWSICSLNVNTKWVIWCLVSMAHASQVRGQHCQGECVGLCFCPNLIPKRPSLCWMRPQSCVAGSSAGQGTGIEAPTWPGRWLAPSVQRSLARHWSLLSDLLGSACLPRGHLQTNESEVRWEDHC